MNAHIADTVVGCAHWAHSSVNQSTTKQYARAAIDQREGNEQNRSVLDDVHTKTP